MADSFFGFDTSLSNLNDDEGGGGPSEDEYDALNDETFGQDSEELDWEVEHEHLAGQLESSRRHPGLDDVNSQLEASLSQLVLDETDSSHLHTLGSSVWRHDLPIPAAPTQPVQGLKNVCTVEELERQMRQKQQSQNFFQPRYPPVILQRPPGLQAPVSLPYAPQQQLQTNVNTMNQPLNKIIGQPNQMMQNQMGQNVNQLGQSVNQMGQTVNQFMQAANHMGQYQSNQMGQNNLMGLSQNMQTNQLLHNQMSQNVSQMVQNQLNHMSQSNQTNQNQMQMGMNQLNQSQGQIGQNMVQNMSQLSQNQMNSLNQMGQNVNQIGQNQLNQIGQSMNQLNQSMPQMGQNQLGQNMGQMGQNVNQMGQSVNQMGQNLNQMGQNVNQMVPNGNQFGQSMNQFPHMMGQPRMMAPPPGMNMNPRQNFNQNMGPYNQTFRGPSIQSKPEQIPQPMMNQYQTKNQSPLSAKTVNNQSPQTKPGQINKTQAKTDPKTKSRVFNSKPQANLTSQNLVQLIQNTHPMLHMNSSYHNASHHPMLNNRTMFNNQFVNNQIFNQRLNGTMNSTLNGDDSSGCSDSDEYAGLMTQREKQWLINIQMLQLNTGTPYIHDFYYTVFLERQASKEKEGLKEAHKANQQNHPFYSGGVKQETHTRERHNSNRHNSTSEDSAPRTYVPAQFENSLGKLQCGSVTAPRKIIDVEVVGTDTRPPSRAPSRASTTNPNEVPRELKRTKQLLLDIEALYTILLRLEELNDPLAISNALILKEREEKQRQLEAAQKELEDQEEDSNLFLKNIESVQRRPKQESPKSETIDKRQVVNLAVCQKPPVKNLLDEDKDELVGKMFYGLLHGDRLPQALTVRKGRILVSRFLVRVPPTHPRLRTLWSRILRSITTAARRDDGTLVALAPHYRRYIQATSGWTAVLESCSMLAEAFDPARTPYALTSSFTLSCVCTLVERATTLVNTPEATSNERQWSKFLKTLARALKNTTLNIAKPLHPIPESRLMCHIKQLESRTTIEILQRGKSATEFADVSKTDVQEQLIKHLC
ncbi:unnamed protein product [Chilo suppressalis]|uniref:mRNA decay factor PAT1 domain-containing protein n=1 Tax=Chilo suppressalis TaxID=168631 RepID=A0ABN8B7L8_CHISP|nr:unnamed protein product [Chilo suppressalis]